MLFTLFAVNLFNTPAGVDWSLMGAIGYNAICVNR